MRECLIYLLLFNKSEVIRTPIEDFGDRHTNRYTTLLNKKGIIVRVYLIK